MRKFRRAQVENKAAIEKHLVANNLLDSSSEDEEIENALETAVDKVLSLYQVEGGDTEKTLSYLSDVLQSGGAICLICISSVKKTDAVRVHYYFQISIVFNSSEDIIQKIVTFIIYGLSFRYGTA